MRDPADPNSVIDMRHFLVVGKQGELFGLGVEIGQALSSNPDARSSAFDPQDFYSNALGANFLPPLILARTLETSFEGFSPSGNTLHVLWTP